jgi:hypothetical protein
MKQYGIDVHAEGRDRRVARGGRRLVVVVWQVFVCSAIAWAIAGLLTLLVWGLGDQDGSFAFALACVLTGIAVLTFGAFSLMSGGIADDSDMLAWAGAPVFTRGREQGTPGGLTTLGAAMFVAPQLLGAGALLLG